MVAASILPVAIHKGKLYFLFGKENEMEDSAKGFSDFGGRVENNESILDTAYREGSEEFCGFLGDEQSVKRLIQENGGYMMHSHNDYHIHIFSMKYDENLPSYFTNHHRFMWNKMDKQMLNASKLYEKQEICWFSVDDLTKRRNDFRSFYRKIADELRNRIPEIRKFIGDKTKNRDSLKRTRRRRRLRGGG
jgi:hypothetical protein